MYLRLVRERSEPPSGPEIAAELGGGRSVQWVRKRAHTIRRKQREFKMPELVLTRKSTSPAAERGAFSPPGRRSDSFDLDMQYGA